MSEPSRILRQEIGGVVPEIQLPMISGETGSLSTFLQGKRGAVVVFWSETCSHCIRYDGYLNSFSDSHPEISLVAVASRRGENLGQIRAAVAARNLRFPIFHDSGGSVARQWFTQQTPRAFLIDMERRLLYRYRGAIDNFRYPQDPEYRAYLEPGIEAYLAGRPIERKETASFGCAVESVYYILPKALA